MGRVDQLQKLSKKMVKVSHVHIRWISPLQRFREILIQFKNILVPEINLGQFLRIIRSEFL